jgi:hypothetical protein
VKSRVLTDALLSQLLQLAREAGPSVNYAGGIIIGSFVMFMFIPE